MLQVLHIRQISRLVGRLFRAVNEFHQGHGADAQLAMVRFERFEHMLRFVFEGEYADCLASFCGYLTLEAAAHISETWAF